ncbi:MAG: carboxypeptidase regulatory-like domain-containing protein [Methanothrix sp.]|nr:carboxypeptidase regulatory-like domain-containing protein [Methanothrix sp.]
MENGRVRPILLLSFFAVIFSGCCPSGFAAPAQAIKDQATVSLVDNSIESSITIYPCDFQGIVRDAATGAPIKGASVTFVKEDRSKSWTATTSESGRYRRELPEGRYNYIATHSDYILASSTSPVEVKAPYTRRVRGAGGIVREITVTSEKSRTVDISMKARPTTVLLATTTLLTSTPELEAAIGRYVETVRRKDGLAASRVVLDSEECRTAYGVRLADPASWEEIRDVLRTIADRTGPCYIILLGGPEVLPVPQMVTVSGSPWYLPADGWYIDFDGNGVVDEGYSISRMPDVGSDSVAVAAALETASDVHEAGGFGMIPEMLLSTRCWSAPPAGLGDACRDDAPTCGNCYATPPYGVCDECDHRAEMFDQISRSDYIFIMGHGSPVSFATNDHTAIFNLENVADVDISRHPIISGWVSCNTGQLYADRPSFATELLRAGAAAFFARTTDQGTPAYFADKFEPYIKGESPSGRYRLGDALNELMREVILRKGESERRITMQLCMFGDPTLKRAAFELPAAGMMATASAFSRGS